jgi:hypothetical protein
MPAQLCFVPEVLHVSAWPDEMLDRFGFDPRSGYVEEFWLGVLGPSTVWLLRRLAAGFDYCPDGFDLDLDETARSLGIGDRSGRHSPFVRAINRTVQFGLSQLTGSDQLAVRRRLPALNRGMLKRLSPAMQARHASWEREQALLSAGEEQQRRARQLALSLLELGEDYGSAERQLVRWRYPANVAAEALHWANAQRTCEGPSGRVEVPGSAGGRPAGTETALASVPAYVGPGEAAVEHLSSCELPGNMPCA